MLDSSIVLKLESLLTRSGEINDALSQEGATDDMAKFTQLNKEYAEITPIVNQFKLLQGLEGELSGAKELLKSGDSELIELAKELANDSKASIELVIGSAESIPYPDNFFDTVLVTYTMCTIPNVAIANKEMWRVLKDDGRLIFCEHGLAPDKKISKWQNRIDPFWGKIAGGCHLNRDIQKLITDAGFSFESLDKMYIPSTPKFAGYNYWGIGKK